MLNDLIQLLGVANPQLSKNWTTNGESNASVNPTVDADGFTIISDSGDEWVAPFASILTENQHHSLLQLPDHTFPSEGIVLQAMPQVYLALTRLIAVLIEGKTANTTLAERPVPKYFLYRDVTRNNWTEDGESRNGPSAGYFPAGTTLHMGGKLTIHDEEGLPIDPIAVAAMFNELIQTHWSLESKSIGSTAPSGSTAPPFTQPAARQLNTIAATGGNAKRVYLTDIFNKPFDLATNPFQNISVVTGNNALFNVSDVSNAITKTGEADALLQLAIATNGSFSNSLNYPSLRSGLTLTRDFIRVKFVNWKEHLLGTIPESDPASANNVLPAIRDNESMQFCFNGNECFGRITQLLASGSTQQTIASTSVETDFNLPPAPVSGTEHLWPNFAEGISISTADIPSNIKEKLIAAAHFISDAATNNTDVYLELSTNDGSLQNGWAVRVFHRVFHSDGRESRGDGAGTIVRNNVAAFRLKDPLGVNHPYVSVVVPADALLIIDVIIVNGANPVQKRRIGNIVTAIQAASTDIPNLLSGTNTLNTSSNIGIAPGGFLGNRTSTSAISAISNINTYLLASGSETQPRTAPVLPTQSRLDGIVAAKRGTEWQAFAGGLQLRRSSRENFLFIGNPGSPAGEDTHTTGLVTSGGRLAYDLLRAALRRSRNIAERMALLINNNEFTLPAVPTATGRNIIGAVLQNIAKKTESPRIAEFATAVSNLPADAAALSNQLQQLINSNTKPAWMPDTLKDQFRTALAGTTAGADHQQAFEELRREYVTSIHGRSDTSLSIKKAIESARHFIYVESSFFGPTKYSETSTPPADDLVEVIRQQLISRPGLKLIICIGQEIPLNRGYENIARFHKRNRHAAVLRLLGDLNTTTHKHERHNQVVAFHPLGYPGRPVKIGTQCIVVDDVYAIMGTSNFNQRGLFFDGSTDVVFSDKQLRGGKGASIRSLRKQLMLQYIRSNDSVSGLPSTNQVFLHDGRSSFEMMRALIDGGGAGMIKEFVPESMEGITPQELTALNNVADPNGNTFYQDQALVTTWLAALSTVPE